MDTPKPTDRLGAVKPKMLRADASFARLQAERQAIGYAFAKALFKSGISRQEATFLMGYTNQRVISDWTSGRENVQSPKLRLLGSEFWKQWLIAQAQLDGLPVKTTIATSSLEGPIAITQIVEWTTADQEEVA